MKYHRNKGYGRGLKCAGSHTRIEIVISKLLSLTKTKADASDEVLQENYIFVGTIGLTNNPATCPDVMSWKVREYFPPGFSKV